MLRVYISEEETPTITKSTDQTVTLGQRVDPYVGSVDSDKPLMSGSECGDSQGRGQPVWSLLMQPHV